MYIYDRQLWGVVGEDDSHQCKSGEGPPAVLPDPEGKGPHPLIYRGVTPKRSRNPSTGDAQILLNRFLKKLETREPQCKPGADMARIQQIRKSLTQDPLVVDCRFGPNTDKATLMFQRCVFPENSKKWDGKIGPETWTELDKLRVTPRKCPPERGPLFFVPPILSGSGAGFLACNGGGIACDTWDFMIQKHPCLQLTSSEKDAAIEIEARAWAGLLSTPPTQSDIDFFRSSARDRVEAKIREHARP